MKEYTLIKGGLYAVRKRILGIVLAFSLLLSLAPAVWADEIRIVDAFENEEEPITVLDGAEALAPEDAAAGTLYVESSPSGADLYLDGELYVPAVTPCEVPLSAGSHSLSIRMAGYDDYEATVSPGDSVSVRLTATVPEGPNVRTLIVDADDQGHADSRYCTWDYYERFVVNGEPEPGEDADDTERYAYWTMTDGVSLREALCIVMNDTGWYDEIGELRWYYVVEFSSDKDCYTQTANITCYGRGTAPWINGEELFMRRTWEGVCEDLEAKALWRGDACFTINGDRDRDGMADVTLEGSCSWGSERQDLMLMCSDAHVVGVNFARTMHVAITTPFWQPLNYFNIEDVSLTNCVFESFGNNVGRFFINGPSQYGACADGFGQPGAYDIDGFTISGCSFVNEQIGIIGAGGDRDYSSVRNLVIQGNHVVNGMIFVRNVDAHTWYMWPYNGEMSGTDFGYDCIGTADYNTLENVTISGNLVEFTQEAVGSVTYDGSYGNVINLGNSNLGGSHNTMRSVTVRGNRSTLEQANIDAYEWYPNAGVSIENACVGDSPYAQYDAELASQLCEVSDNLFEGLTVEYNDFAINYFHLNNFSMAGSAQVGTDNCFRNIRVENNRIESVTGLHFYGTNGTSNLACTPAGALEGLTVSDNVISVLRKSGWGPDSQINGSGEQDDYGILVCGANVANYDLSNWDESGEEQPWEGLASSVSGVQIARNRISGFANGLLIAGAECGRTHYVTGIRVSDVTVSDNEIVTDGVNVNCRNDGIVLLGAIDGGTDCAVSGVTVSGNSVTACNGLLAAGFFYRGMTCRWGIRDNQVLGVTATGNSFIYQDPSGNGGFPILTADAVSGWSEIPYELGRSAVQLRESGNSRAGFAWGSMELAALSEHGYADTAKFLRAAQGCSDAATGGRYIDWTNPGGALFMGVCDRPNYRPGNCHRFYLCPRPSSELGGYTLTVDDSRVTDSVSASLVSGGRYRGEVAFTVSNLDGGAVLVAVKNGDSYTVLPCASACGEHRFSLNVTKNTELALVCKGDADLNGRVNMRDGLSVKQYVAGTGELSGLALLAAEADGRTGVNMRDGLAIKRQSAGTEMIAW